MTETPTTEPDQPYTIPPIDWEALTDDQVIAFHSEVAQIADRRMSALALRNDTRDLAHKAKDLGRTPEQVSEIITDVMTEVFAPEPDPDQAELDLDEPEPVSGNPEGPA